MASRHTTLCIVNTTGMDIEEIRVTEIDDFDWDGDSRPDINFQGVSIANNDSRCEREELNKLARSAWYRMTLRFSDGRDLTFRNDQWESKTKYDRFFHADGTAVDDLTIYQTSGSYTNAMYVRTKREPDNASWMGELLGRKPNVKLDQLTMPGSHDAGMYVTGDCHRLHHPEWVLTQSDNINRQIKCGSRYFDLRFYYDGSDYRIGHFGRVPVEGPSGCYGPTLSDVLNQVKDFIQSDAGRSETVILKFSHTMGDSPESYPVDEVASEVAKRVKADLHEYLFKSRDSGINLAETPLSELAGKIVAVFDVEFQPYWDSSIGIFSYRDYPTQDYGALKVYDKYSDTASYPEMSADQLEKLKNFGGYGHEYLFLLSWTLTGKVFDELFDIQVLSTLARPWLPQILTGIRDGKYKHVPNIVYYDFVDPYINRAIINLNF